MGRGGQAARASSSMIDQMSAWPVDCSWNCMGGGDNKNSSNSIKTSASSSDSEDERHENEKTTQWNQWLDKARDMACSSSRAASLIPCGNGCHRTYSGTLGIARMTAPGQDNDDNEYHQQQQLPRRQQHAVPLEELSARDRRIQRYHKKQQEVEERLAHYHHHEDIEVLPNHGIQVRLPPTHSVERPFVPPLESLEVKADTVELERCISELTMRSRDAYPCTDVNMESRRMAFYAVGKNRTNDQSGNRRCYFTSKLILSGSPFYAGCLQQGMRTLVVFCLPSALGLPLLDDKESSKQGLLSGIFGSQETSRGVNSRAQRRRSATSKNIMSKSRLSSHDDLSMSNDGDLDPNWNMGVDFLLQRLPPPDATLLAQVGRVYPSEFETLPSPLREPAVWKLYVTFCFFSGLPISDGELYYKVRDNVADHVWGEHIVLSHEVIEAAHGESADLISMPNQHTFRYLQKNYTQQCAKLDDSVFQRNSWERVAPEV